MKKSLIALAVLAASGASFAQSSVSIYGIADVWFGRTTATNTPSQIVLNSGGVSGSRFGFKGSEDLGGGLKANFLLEQGFNIDNGSTTAGQAFSRLSYVGFSGGFGEVKLGKIGTALDDIGGATHAVFDSVLSPTSNGVWKSNDFNWNPANGLYYVSPKMGGVSAAVSYALGENKTASVDAGSVVAINVKYEGGPVYVGLAHQREKATDNSEAGKFTRLNGSYDLGVAKLLAGYGRVAGVPLVGAPSAATSNFSTTEWELGADFPVSGALTLSAGIARSSDNAAKGDATRKGYGLGAAYTMSKRTTVYGGYQSAKTTTPGVADTDATSLAVGLKHTF